MTGYGTYVFAFVRRKRIISLGPRPAGAHGHTEGSVGRLARAGGHSLSLATTLGRAEGPGPGRHRRPCRGLPPTGAAADLLAPGQAHCRQ